MSYYPINIEALARRGQRGSGPDDPKLPDRPRRRRSLRWFSRR